MAAVGPEPRDSALAFTEGVRAGWIASDLHAWVDDHLVLPGRLVLRDRHLSRVREHGVGLVQLGSPAASRREARTATGAQIVSVLAAARDRVITTLRTNVESGQASFVNAALYAGRVSRERNADGRSSWHVLLNEDVPLSDQVLALFAADALTNPQQYEADLSVCVACGAISFSPAETSRRGCAIHPFGSYDSTPSPSSVSGAQRILARS